MSYYTLHFLKPTEPENFATASIKTFSSNISCCFLIDIHQTYRSWNCRLKSQSKLVSMFTETDWLTERWPNLPIFLWIFCNKLTIEVTHLSILCLSLFSYYRDQAFIGKFGSTTFPSEPMIHLRITVTTIPCE